MAALAELALARGLKVQGSDIRKSPATTRLEALGAKVFYQHHPDHLREAKTLIRSSAIVETNAEIGAAQSLGLPIWHRSHFLAYLMLGREAITVAGTHGKTTTTAMISHALEALGIDPTVACGGEISRLHSPARCGQGDVFVAEADESDGSFMNYQPHIAVITNIDHDHMEYYRTVDALCTAFVHYTNQVDDHGAIIVGWDSPLVRQTFANYDKRRLAFGFLLGSDVRAYDLKTVNGRSIFTAIVERDRVPCNLPCFGQHNVLNALATLAVVRAMDLDVHKAAAALETYAGVARRMSLIHSRPGLKVFDDYAHNPGKIASCLQGLKRAFPGEELHVVFQPHRFSRLETMYEQMLGSLTEADKVYVVPVYAAGETTTLDFSVARLSLDLKKMGVLAYPCDTLEMAFQTASANMLRSSVLLCVGAGDVWRVAEMFKNSEAS